MCKKLLKSILFLFAFLLAFVGIVAFSLRLRLLDENFLKIPLRESGIYQYMPELIAAKLEEGSVQIREQAEKEQVESDLSDPFEDQEFSMLIANQILLDIATNPEMEEVIQSTVEKNIENIYSWLNGNTEDIIIFLPQEELSEFSQPEDLFDTVYSLYLKESGINSLPECPEGYIPTNVLESEELNPSELTCRSEEILELVINELREQLPEDDFNFVDSIFLANGIDENSELTLSELATDSPDEKAQFQDSIDMAQRWIEMSLYIIILFLALSLIFSLLAALLSEHPRLKIVPKVYFFAGLLTTAIAGIFMFTLNQTIANLAPLQSISFPEAIISESEKTQILDIIDSFISSLVSNLFETALIFGGAITIISLLLWIIVRVTSGVEKGEETEVTSP